MIPLKQHWHLEEEDLLRKKWPDILVVWFQHAAKDLLCDNWRSLLATGVQVHVFSVYVCVYREREKVKGCVELSSQLCFKANIANSTDWPAAWCAVQPAVIPDTLQSHHWLSARIFPVLSCFYLYLYHCFCHAVISFTLLSFRFGLCVFHFIHVSYCHNLTCLLSSLMYT